ILVGADCAASTTEVTAGAKPDARTALRKTARQFLIIRENIMKDFLPGISQFSYGCSWRPGREYRICRRENGAGGLARHPEPAAGQSSAPALSRGWSYLTLTA